MFHFCTVDWLIDCCGFQRFCHSTKNQPGSCVCNRFQVSFHWLSNPFTWSVSEGSLESGGMTLSVTLRSRSCVWPDYQRSPTASKHWRQFYQSIIIFLLVTDKVGDRSVWIIVSMSKSWLGGRKGIRPAKKLSGGVLVWLSVWSEVQTCIWPSW